MRTHSRRSLLGAGMAAAGSGLLTSTGAYALDTRNGRHHSHHTPPPPDPHDGHGANGSAPAGYVSPDGPEVIKAERARGTGPVRRFSVTASEAQFDMGGQVVDTWSYGDLLPGNEVRVKAGERVAMTLHNRLPHSTTIHWHGVQIRNDMDGSPDVTQRSVKAGASYDYNFAVDIPGTYWFHPHVGVQLDRGLYAPFIVEDPREPLFYDHEWVVMIDDWLDGVDGMTPDAMLDELTKGKSDGGMSGHSEMRRGGNRAAAAAVARMRRSARHRMSDDPSDNIEYPFHVMNGRVARDRETFRAKPGDRIRIRLINAAAATAYRVALGGHNLTVTHIDGYPVQHKDTDSLLIAMGERFDVLVTAKDGVFPLTALSAGSNNQTAQALLRTGDGDAPDDKIRPTELRSGGLSADKFKAASSVRLSDRKPDRTIKLDLTGNMDDWDWAINGKPYSASARYPVEQGERVRLTFHNTTTMWHPMHLHGHTFALANGGPRKDTTIVLPDKEVSVDFDADNPGLWMLHCHNIYHSESGMMTVMGYKSQR
ncbi:multicopper oxidase family protein [Streptomyces sp. BHT-5-2]|uniref:multicopper oxidase family protein n=1 Tax=Streptomyces sp. BHT-5-2 TaxID=2866715 RepID=UPI001C8D9B95|nr:multicopper oxidase family protein [Streptomyces sp. BHT-5-2]QZL05054.1 multicopper oxidase family protein [Streptomyces sp. BHT-5-2]